MTFGSSNYSIPEILDPKTDWTPKGLGKDPENNAVLKGKERCSGSFHLAVGFLVIKDDSISERPSLWQWRSRYTAHQDGTYLSRNFATLGPVTDSRHLKERNVMKKAWAAKLAEFHQEKMPIKEFCYLMSGSWSWNIWKTVDNLSSSKKKNKRS